MNITRQNLALAFWTPCALFFIAGLVLGALAPHRWEFHVASGEASGLAYRFDRLTGRGSVSAFGHPWKPIPEDQQK